MLSHHLEAPLRHSIGASDKLATGYGVFAPRSHHFSGGIGSRIAQPARFSRRIDRGVGKRGQLTDQSLHLDAIIGSFAAASRLEWTGPPIERSTDRIISTARDVISPTNRIVASRRTIVRTRLLIVYSQILIGHAVL